MNILTLQPTQFTNLRTGEITQGFTASDNYGRFFSDSFDAPPSTDDMTFLKQVIDFQSPTLQEMIGHVIDRKAGVTIGKQFYEWTAIAGILSDAGPSFHGGPITIGLHGSKNVVILDNNSWGQMLVSARFEDAISQKAGSGAHQSELSKEPAYQIDVQDRDRELRLRLTAGEFRRLILRSLTPEEYAALKASHGTFFWINPNLYTPAGEAITPAL